MWQGVVANFTGVDDVCVYAYVSVWLGSVCVYVWESRGRGMGLSSKDAQLSLIFNEY